jgi:hypothetical protein
MGVSAEKARAVVAGIESKGGKALAVQAYMSNLDGGPPVD